MIELRLAAPEDFEFLLSMKSDPTEVTWSGFGGPPERDSFLSFYVSALANPDRVMFTAVDNGDVVGYIHFNRSRDNRDTWIVSTGVRAELRSKGVGTELRKRAIAEMAKRFNPLLIEAWLAEGNTASRKSWAKMGYEPTDISRQTTFYCPERVETVRRWVKKSGGH